MLLVMNESGVQKLLKNKVNLGADASVAAGPVGRRGGVSTDAALTAEILSLLALERAVCRHRLLRRRAAPDEDANTGNVRRQRDAEPRFSPAATCPRRPKRAVHSRARGRSSRPRNRTATSTAAATSSRAASTAGQCHDRPPPPPRPPV